MASTTAAPKMPRFAVIARFLPAGSCGIGPVLPAGETIARQWRQVPCGSRRDARSVALLTTANGALSPLTGWLSRGRICPFPVIAGSRLEWCGEGGAAIQPGDRSCFLFDDLV